MARNGSGTFNRLYDWTDERDAGNNIDATKMDAEMDGMATALTDSIAKDGQTTPTADLPMGGFKHTGVDDGTARTHYTRLDQAQDGKLAWADSGGTADAITATYSPALTALVDGQLCYVRAGAANATTTPTFSPNGLTARTIVKEGGNALVAGDIVGDGHELILRYLLASTRWELLNPAPAAKQADVITTRGDMIRGSSAGAAERRAIGTAGKVWGSDGTDADWVDHLPTRQVFLSGSGTYTTPASCRAVVVRMVGGGGGGGGNGTSGQTAGGDGGDTTFSTYTAGGGGGGPAATGGSLSSGASGGTASGSPDIGLAGGGGGSGSYTGTTPAAGAGGIGGSSAFGGGGRSAVSGGGNIGRTNTGGGGAGAAGNSTVFAAGGGGSGAYIEHRIASPSATYSYAVGAAGTAGGAGTSGSAGGAGGSGMIIVDEFY